MKSNITNPFEHSIWFRSLIIVGGGALFIVMLVEVVAVVGRLIGWPLLGAIELAQWLIAISGSLSLLVATLYGSHAVVMLITNNLSPGYSKIVYRMGALLCALFFVFLSLGSMWLATDLWTAFEESELFHLPFKPLRILVSVIAILVAVAFVYQSWRKAIT
jgi:TRAP-type transport system small permease protein